MDAPIVRFERHLALCPGCETYLNQIMKTADLLGEVSVETLSEETQTTLLAAFAGSLRSHRVGDAA